MRMLVAYTSKYGSTKQYAEWIGESLGATVQEAAKTGVADLESSDVVVIGCHLHIGQYVGVEILKNNWQLLQNKKVALFTVSGAPGEDPQQKGWYETNVPAEIRAKIRHFPMQGRARNLDRTDRLLLAFPRTLLWIKYLRHRTQENYDAMRTFKPFDGVKREYIQPVVEYVKS